MKLNPNQRKRYEVVLELGEERFEVSIEPLPKSADLKLVSQHTKGRTMIHGKGKGQKESSFDMSLPETDQFTINLERAKRTWKRWNLESDEGSVELNEANLTALFENYYDALVLPVFNRLDELIEGEASAQEASGEY
ncbi:MAG: hypothetical protein RRB13_02665 [bacterium]|nr:hypothetical protein [bacterium]